MASAINSCSSHSLLCSAQYLLQTSHLSDVTFDVGSEKKSIKAHKLILAMRSPVFEAMFYGPIAEDCTRSIEIVDISSDVFEGLLQYLYCDEFCVGTVDEAWDMWYVANKYMLKELVESCVLYIDRELDVSNVLPALEQALAHSERQLEEKCWKIVDKEAKQLLMSSAFLNLNLDIVQQIIKRQSLFAREVEIFQASLVWAQQNNLTDPQKSLREIVEPLLPYIAFSNMSLDELATVVVPSSVLNVREERDALLAAVHRFLPTDKWSCERRLNRVVYNIAAGKSTMYFWTGGKYETQFALRSRKPCYFSGIRIGKQFKVLNCMNGSTHDMPVNGKDCLVSCYVETQDASPSDRQVVELSENKLTEILDIELKDPLLLKPGISRLVNINIEMTVTAKNGLPVVDSVQCKSEHKLTFEFVEITFTTKGCGLPSNSLLYIIPI